MDIRRFFTASSEKKSQGKSESQNGGKVKESEVKASNQKQSVKESKRRKSSKDKNVKNEKSKQNSESEKVKQKESKKKIVILDSDSEDIDFNQNETSKESEKNKNSKVSKKSEKKNSDEYTHVKKKHTKKEISSEEETEDVIIKKTTKQKSGRSKRVLESDSEEEPLPKKARKKSRKQKSVFSDESEEEKPMKSTLDSFLSPTAKGKPGSVKKQGSGEKKKTPVSLENFFGTAAIKRTERSTVAAKRKLEEDVKKKDFVDGDMEMHDDDDFVKALEQSDGIPKSKKARVTETPEKESPMKQNGSKEIKTGQEKKNLASKLSSKAKGVVFESEDSEPLTVLVPDTPTVKKNDGGTKKASLKKTSPMKFSSQKTSPVKVSPKKTSPVTFSPKKTSPVTFSPKKTAPETSKTPTTSKTSPKKVSPNTPLEKKGSTYRSYLHREGPRALGSKEIPEGGENCLEGLTFVITGVLESLEREEAKHLVEKHGGKVTGSISKKTSYLVYGRDSGESKLAKAKSLGTKLVDEDGLLELIKTLPGKKSKYEIQAQESLKKEKSLSAKSTTPAAKEKLSQFERKKESVTSASPSKSSSQSDKKESSQSGESLMWVDKYKPVSLKQIIGQQGDKSNAKKLLHWLTRWHKNQADGIKPQGKFSNRFDDGSGYKAALLSGPPGIGKTTTATLVCQEAGFSYVELNASDTRSKKTLKEVVSESLSNTTMVDYVAGSSAKTQGRKHCLLMDEVDGMAGNEDRGGLQELVSLIKSSHIPVICMCNDRNHQKMRTLSNYCFDLRFQKPRLEQIKGAMMSIAYKEGVKIPAPAMNEIILAANQDIRQTLHNMSLWTASEKSLTYEQAKKDSKSAKKDFKIGPFDACRRVFVGGEETRGMTINDKADLYFQDYSLMPLFVQENYIHVSPFAAGGNPKKHLSLLARAADSLCDGDLVDRRIRSAQSWSLLPTAAIYASVIPGEYMRGAFPQMVNFPGWLGKNSTTNKTDRILQELGTHMRLQTSGDKRALNMDYLPFMRNFLTKPLVEKGSEGVEDVISLMDTYDIIKDDFDNILEISKWPNSKDPMAALNPKTKAAFTRTYNKEVHLTPYVTGTVTKKRRGGPAAVDELDVMGEDGETATAAEVESDEDDTLETDTMIQAKKKPGKAAQSSSKETKGKGKGKGRGKGKS